jgi:hypothetical protein
MRLLSLGEGHETALQAPVKPRRRKTAVKGRGASKSAQILGAGTKEPEVAQLVRERDQALEQLSAASEVLKIISFSPAICGLCLMLLLKTLLACVTALMSTFSCVKVIWCATSRTMEASFRPLPLWAEPGR